MSVNSQICLKPGKHYSLKQFFYEDEALKSVIERLKAGQFAFYSVSGQAGSGITHLLNAIGCDLEEKGLKSAYITSQWLFELIRINKNGDLNELKAFLLDHDFLAIDNIQFFHKRSQVYKQFLESLLTEARKKNVIVFFGCSDPSKDFTRASNFNGRYAPARIQLKPHNSRSVFTLLKNLCTPEDKIPDLLLYVISGYNGSVQQYINCLISVRFKSRMEHIDLFALNEQEILETFRISLYFPKQQLRRSFFQQSLHFISQEVKVRK